ncbi:hypothetical protein Cgig2_010220 [Carnegiea gigantea]|uniref:Uncharacterized protein n=1 Tax=Carnegiea gigantea TaxID=171969 RepID=A0A9Q1Q6X4_9CARY|nr:hypothetical protein Cgig2_010220 [Carnegiea gigantea]
MTRSSWKTQLRSAQEVLTTKQGPRTTVPTMVFGGKEAPRFASPSNDPLVIEMKIASEIMRRILVSTGSFVDIITWDYMKKLAHSGCDIVPLVHPILGFGGQEVNPIGMIRLLVRFGDKLKSKNLEVDFLVVDVPTAYNVILGHPTLHKTPRSLQPWPLRAPPLAGAASISSWPFEHPDQPSAFPSAAGSESLAPPAVGTPLQLSPPERMPQLLIRLDEIGGRPLDTGGRTADGLRGSSHSLKGGGLFLEAGDCRGADRSTPTSPAWVEADAAVSSGGPRFIVACGPRPQSQRPSTSPSLALHKTKGKSGQNQARKLTNIGTTNTLRKILKDQKARRGKEEVVPKKFQLREPIQGFPIIRLALPLLRTLHRFYHLSHKLGDGSGLIVLLYVELEITGPFSFLGRGLPKGVLNRLTLIPVRNVPLT